MTNKQKFQLELENQYEILKEKDFDYKAILSNISPKELAEKMTNALNKGSGNKDGKGIKRTCKALKIKYTYKDIKEYLQS